MRSYCCSVRTAGCRTCGTSRRAGWCRRSANRPRRAPPLRPARTATTTLPRTGNLKHTQTNEQKVKQTDSQTRIQNMQAIQTNRHTYTRTDRSSDRQRNKHIVILMSVNMGSSFFLTWQSKLLVDFFYRSTVNWQRCSWCYPQSKNIDSHW